MALVSVAGFNGAATNQPRKSPHLVVDFDRLLASMGPRLISRGNMRRPRGCGPRRTSFNGAAADQPRKFAAAPDLLAGVKASMGPRLISRGNM